MTAREIAKGALELGSSERTAYLGQACGGDQQLLAEVQAILSADIAALDGAETVVSVGEDTTEAFIGPYRLLRKLGEGGMGIVYHARQQHPIRRDVALKIIKPGMDSKQVIARFESERQALAMMDHPNIARVFDAGATDRGLPYFVMELVEGVPITGYCDSKRLTLRERIELLIPVCQAIQHAHQKGIIHRDIKPSNVLVKQQENQAVPKVIDFGLAKALGSQMSDATMMTNLGAVVGTLQYMSPEQAEIGRQDIDTRSDVYSLGALLYELLTAATPLDTERTAKATYVEILQRIREEEPKPPSTRLRESAGLKDVAALRQSDSGHLPKLLDHELDWITMKALEKERTRRYETANGLVRDLQRYLAGEPVEAAPPSAAYRIGKLARRYRIWLATAAAFAAVLIGGVVVSTWMAVRASRAEVRARQAADEARTVNEFLQRDLLAQVSADNQARPGQKPDPDLKVRTALDRAAAHVEGAFQNKPLVEASIRQTIGTAYADLGLYQQAQPHLERALKLRLANQAADDLAVANAKDALAHLYADQSNPQAALPLAREILDVRRRKLGPEHPETLEALNDIGALLDMAGRTAEAEPFLRQTLQGRTRALGRHNADTLESMGNLAALLQDEGKAAEAEPLAQEAANGYRKLFGPDHPRTLWALTQLGSLYNSLGKYSEAETVLRETLERKLRVLGPDHPDTALAMNDLGMSVSDQKRYPEAEDLYLRAQAIYRKALAAGQSESLAPTMNLALLYQQEKRYAEAEAAYAEVIRFERQVSGESSSGFDGELAALGVVRLELHKFAEAEPVLRESLELRKKRDPNGYRRYNSESALGASLAGQSKYAQAEPFLLSGYEGMKQLGDKLPESGKPRFKLAGERIVQLYESWGKPQQAAEWRAKLRPDRMPGEAR
ncbi:MAG: serine/threonine-protein kinase [Bryobacteraceae bacterium]|jgi:serine/threonine protein kinase